MKIPEELNKKIIVYCENNPAEVEWHHDTKLSNDQIEKILSSEDGLAEVQDEYFNHNLDYICDLEQDFIKYSLKPEFESELIEAGIDEAGIDDFLDEYRSYVIVDMKFEKLTDININCLIYLYSDFDCTNSFDTMEDSEYLRQVYQRVKTGVRKKDFIWEHINGAYGGSLFCFIFSNTLTNVMELTTKLKEKKQILIPKGTQFGYFSSSQGAGSVFEKTTYRNMKLNIRETGGDFHPDYDRVDIIADVTQSYNMDDVYGGFECDEQTIKLI